MNELKQNSDLPRIIFMGYGKGLKLICDQAKKDFNIVGIFTQSKNFYKENINYFENLKKYDLYHDIVDYCEQEQIDCFQSDSVTDKEALKWFKKKNPDLVICYSLWEIVKEPFLKSFPKTFNIHGSNIPNLMGRAPQSWAILNGFKKIGWSIHKMTKDIDQGDIAIRTSIPIKENDIPLTILNRQLEELPKLINHFLKDYFNNKIKYKKPNSYKGNYWPRLNTEIDGEINWNSSSITLERVIRAFNRPFPGAWINIKKNKVRILEAKIFNEDFVSTKPGIIYRIDNTGCYVTTLDGAIIISKIESDGIEKKASEYFRLGQVLS